MARSKEVDLTTPTARKRLRALPSRVPHWRFISRGRYLGYRRHLAEGGGTWCARVYEGRKRYVETAIGTADDTVPADGVSVLSYRQALEAAFSWCDAEERKTKSLPRSEARPYTVAQAIDDYLRWFAAHRKSLADTQAAITAHILPALGSRDVASLTPLELSVWHQALVGDLRPTRRGKPRPVDLTDPEMRRRRRASANRILTILKAALNHAFESGEVLADEAWKRVKPFRGVDLPAVAYLTLEEATRLCHSCESDFAVLVRSALHTGCRYGELVVMKVRDYRPEAQAVHVAYAKGGSPRFVYLGEEGSTFFSSLARGREAEELMFLRSDGQSWGKSHQSRRLSAACRKAGVPETSFHVLRHTYASLLAMRGAPLAVIAAQLGHSDTRMTVRHYAHLAPSYVADTVRQHLPRFLGGG